MWINKMEPNDNLSLIPEQWKTKEDLNIAEIQTISDILERQDITAENYDSFKNSLTRLLELLNKYKNPAFIEYRVIEKLWNIWHKLIRVIYIKNLLQKLYPNENFSNLLNKYQNDNKEMVKLNEKCRQELEDEVKTTFSVHKLKMDEDEQKITDTIKMFFSNYSKNAPL